MPTKEGWAAMRDEAGKLPAYAWPGGYAIAYLCADGEWLCATCANDPSNPIVLAESYHWERGVDEQWTLVGAENASMHDTGEGDWICAHCNAVIDASVDDD